LIIEYKSLVINPYISTGAFGELINSKTAQKYPYISTGTFGISRMQIIGS